MARLSKTMEHYDELFGIIAIEKGYITCDELIHAIEIQKKNGKNGNQRFIRDILFEKNIMSVKQIEEVVEAVFQRIG